MGFFNNILAKVSALSVSMEETTLWDDIINYFNEAMELENINAQSGLVSLPLVFLGLFVGAAIAAIVSVYNKRVLGEFVRTLASGGYPIILSHWQSLMSNGLRTGLRILDEIASRINSHYSDKVEWMSFEEIMRFVVDNPADHPIPDCRRKA